jgi:hypothetical protein
VTAVHDCEVFIKLQNIWFFNVRCFICDAIKFKNTKLCTKHAPDDQQQMIAMNDKVVIMSIMGQPEVQKRLLQHLQISSDFKL